MAEFYNRFAELVVNDRWRKTGKWLKRLIQLWPVDTLRECGITRMLAKKGLAIGELPTNYHNDFRTPEYTTLPSRSRLREGDLVVSLSCPALWLPSKQLYVLSWAAGVTPD